MTLSSRQRLWATLAAPPAVLLATELGLRAGGYAPPAEPPLVLWSAGKDAEMRAARDLHHLDPRCLWSPRPGAPIRFAPGETVNAHGYRGPLRASAPPDGTLRVLLLGESNVFGLGVRYEHTGAARLERLLARKLDVEVVSAGVVRHTVWIGLERYRALGRTLAPRVVVAGFGVSNESVPAPGLDDREKLAAWQANAARAGRALRRGSRVAAWLGELGDRLTGRGARRAPEARRERELAQAAGAETWSGRRRVALDDFEAALRELAREVRADGAELVLVNMPRAPDGEARAPVLARYSEVVRAVAADLGLPHADVRGAFLADYERGADPALDFQPGDPWHLSPHGHRRWAQVVAPSVRAALTGTAR
jgi:lysophospholipase L1-like esterase